MIADINLNKMDEQADPNTTNPQGEGEGAGTPPAGDQGAAPSGSQQAGDQGTAPSGAQPAGQKGDQKDLSGIMEENVDISGLVANAGNQQQIQDFIAGVTIPPHPNTKFDEKNFVELLAGSISLTMTEKKRIIEAIPQLSQFQIDELMKIFEEEKAKFSELEKKHAEQVKELEKQHKGTPEDQKAKAEEEAAKKKEEEEAEDIKKSLGL